MSTAPHVSYGKGTSVLFAFHGYGMDGQQFQVLANSVCAKYKVVGFHFPYHRGGLSDHNGWFDAVVHTIKEIVKEQQLPKFSFAGYSIGSKVVLALLSHFKTQIESVYLFAPYGLTSHWGISFLESGLGKGLFRVIENTTLPSMMIRTAFRLKIISKDDYGILESELDSSKKRQHLRKTFLLLSDLTFDRAVILDVLDSVSGQVQLVFGNQDAIFSLSGTRPSEFSDAIRVLEVDDGHWLLTEKLDCLLLSHLYD